ncbi:MAG: hypothetical protein ACI9HK_006163, partial [Pirellulaceae bacterium]
MLTKTKNSAIGQPQVTSTNPLAHKNSTWAAILSR